MTDIFLTNIIIIISIIAIIIFLLMVKQHIKKMNSIISLKRFIWEQLFLEPVIFFFKWMPGGWGIVARMILYKIILKHMGKNVIIREGVKIYFPDRVSIDDCSGLNDGCIIDGTGFVSIGKYVRIAPRVEIMTSNHIYKSIDTPIKLQGLELKKVTIDDDVWIGISTFIAPGVYIGKGCVIAAHSVVTRNVPSYSIVAGVPAKIIGKRNADLVE